jgi:peptidoglycan/LPS O-acetylase OafA/YrhL
MSNDPIQTWEIRASTGKHFDVLDGIRGVAILMVVSFHAFYTNPQAGFLVHAVGRILSGGWMGVQVFFVLSGFLISYPFFRQKAKDDRFWHLDGYARRRIGKIIPPYYLSIVVFAIYYYIRFADPAYLRSAWGYLLVFSNPYQTAVLFNSSYWSLLVEIHFYIALPLLFFLAKRLNFHGALLFLAAILMLVPLAVRLIVWPGSAASSSHVGYLMTRFPGQLDCFGWGVLFAGMFVSWSGYREELRHLRVFGYAGLFLLAACLCIYAACTRFFNIDTSPSRWSYELFHYLPCVSTFLMLFFVFDPLCLAVRLLAMPWLRFIGIVSYEWFLLHLPVVWLLRDIFGQTGGNLAMYLLKTVLPLILTFIVSVLVYRFFSLPLLNRIRGRKP